MKSVFDVRASKRYDTSMDRNGKRMILFLFFASCCQFGFLLSICICNSGLLAQPTLLSQTAKMLRFIVLYLSVFVPDIPGKRKLSFRVGNLSAVRQRTESIGFSPLRGSHRAARRQKYHYSVMALSYGEAVIHLPSTYRSFPQWEIIAFVTDVAHHHRNVTEECVFSFQGPLPDVAWLAYSITAQIVKCVGLVDLLGKPDRSTFGMIFQF